MNHQIRRPAWALAAGLVASMALSGCIVLRPGVTAADAASTGGPAHTRIVELPTAIKDKGVLVFGSQIASPPLIFFADGSTSIDGINKQVAESVGKLLGVDIKWQQMPFAGLIPAVQSGKVDAGIDVIGDTEQRRQAVDFANYMNQATSPLVRRGNPEQIKSADDLCGLSVAIVRGGVQLELAEDTSKKCQAAGKAPVQVEQFSSPGDARLSVQSGRTAAFLGNTPVMRYIAENPATKDVFEVGGTATYQRQPIGIITAKSQPAIHESIQSALDMMMADGTLTKILAKWRTDDLALAAAPGGTK